MKPREPGLGPQQDQRPNPEHDPVKLGPLEPPELPEAIAVALTVILQATLRNLLLTIAAGTIGYMLLVQYVFA